MTTLERDKLKALAVEYRSIADLVYAAQCTSAPIFAEESRKLVEWLAERLEETEKGME